MQNILRALGFELDRKNRHPVWERPADSTLPRKVVPLDDYPQFEQKLIKRIIRQTGFTPEQFYGATEKTARKRR
jgi:predicted RNA binding protein YcfA (HicA-like mRNA interferase family)